jgi:hypothetical protein
LFLIIMTAEIEGDGLSNYAHEKPIRQIMSPIPNSFLKAFSLTYSQPSSDSVQYAKWLVCSKYCRLIGARRVESRMIWLVSS